MYAFCTDKLCLCTCSVQIKYGSMYVFCTFYKVCVSVRVMSI